MGIRGEGRGWGAGHRVEDLGGLVPLVGGLVGEAQVVAGGLGEFGREPFRVEQGAEQGDRLGVLTGGAEGAGLDQEGVRAQRTARIPRNQLRGKGAGVGKVFRFEGHPRGGEQGAVGPGIAGEVGGDLLEAGPRLGRAVEFLEGLGGSEEEHRLQG